MSVRRPWRLRRQLLLRLMLPVLLIVAAAGFLGTYTAQRLTDRVFDRWLLDAATALAHEVRFDGRKANVELPNVAEAMLLYDETETVYYSVKQGGRHLLGQRGLPEQGSRETAYPGGRAFDAVHAGQAVRIAAVRVDGRDGTEAEVLVAETIRKRQRAQQEVLLTLLPLAALLVAAAVAIAYAVLRTLRPLDLLADRWNARSHASLEPVDIADMPRELAPFARALNDLLSRIRAMLARERDFVSTAAHQLRTPLAGIRLGLARAAEAPDLAVARGVIGELDHSAGRAARLLQQLLLLGRLDPEARGDLDFVEADLVALAHDVGDAFVELALERQIDLELREPPSPVRGTVQPDLFSEAIGNLLDNALRYTPPGGRVVIDFEAEPPAVRVADSGHGVPEEEHEAVFRRFVRGGRTTGEGSGLGLAIVRDIAAIHDAAVVLGTSELGGASVTIRLPNGRPARPPRELSAGPPSGSIPPRASDRTHG